MAGVILLSLLAALGVVFLIVCICGWLWLPADGKGFCVIHIANRRDLRNVRAYLYLLRCGALRLPLVLADEDLEPTVRDELMLLTLGQDSVRYVSPQQREELREMERSTGVFGT